MTTPTTAASLVTLGLCRTQGTAPTDGHVEGIKYEPLAPCTTPRPLQGPGALERGIWQELMFLTSAVAVPERCSRKRTVANRKYGVG